MHKGVIEKLETSPRSQFATLTIREQDGRQVRATGNATLILTALSAMFAGRGIIGKEVSYALNETGRLFALGPPFDLVAVEHVGGWWHVVEYRRAPCARFADERQARLCADMLLAGFPLGECIEFAETAMIS